MIGVQVAECVSFIKLVGVDERVGCPCGNTECAKYKRTLKSYNEELIKYLSLLDEETSVPSICKVLIE